MRNNIRADMIPQRSRFVWLVGCFIVGILLIDIMPFRLPTAIYLVLVLGVILLICDVLIFNQSGFYYYSKLVLLFFLLGLSVSGLHLNLNNTPILNSVYTGTVTAQIGLIEKYDHNRIRLTVTPTISDTDANLQALRKLRIWSYDRHDFNTGDIVRIYGRFFPLSPPSFAGQPDYSRHMWLDGIGATGIAYELRVVKPVSNEGRFYSQILLRLEDYRHSLSDRMRKQLGGFDPAISGISSALLVGMKKTIPREVYNSFQQSGIAHLLAISGLHMGFFCFGIYGVCRYLMSFFPNISQRYPIHKSAAFLSILSASFYLVISGAPTSAVRAWMMASAVMIAVILDARILTVRNLAIVLVVMLLINPANIFSISFQLSAIATFFIIGLFEALKPYALKRQFLSTIWQTMIASIAASIATLPFIAWYFQIITPWGVIANLVAVPFTGFVIMPVGIIYLFLVIIGLGDLLAPLFGACLNILLQLAVFFEGLPLSGFWVKSPPSLSLVLVPVAGLLFFCVNRPYRSYGLIVSLAFLIIWAVEPIPSFLTLKSGNKIIISLNDGRGRTVINQQVKGFLKSRIKASIGAHDYQICDTERCKQSRADASEKLYICFSGTNIVAQIVNEMLMKLDDNKAQETNYYDRCTLVPELAEQGSLTGVLLPNQIMHFKSNQTRYGFKPWRVD